MRLFGKKIKIGWTTSYDWWDLVSDIPERFQFSDEIKGAPKFCPATQLYYNNTFVIRSPFSVKLKCEIGPKSCLVVPEFGADMGIDRDLYNRLFMSHPTPDLADPKKPVVQYLVEQIFVSDTPDVWIESVPAHFHYKENPWPVRTYSGSFNIYDWQRPLNWAFEWMNPEKEIVIKRGDPLIYVRFHSKILNAKYELVRIDKSSDLKASLARADFASKKLRGVGFKLFERARTIRPKKFIK